MMKRQQQSHSSCTSPESDKEPVLSGSIMLSQARKGSHGFAAFVPLLGLVTALMLVLLLVITSGAYRNLSLELQLSHLVGSSQGEENICDPSAQHSNLSDSFADSFSEVSTDKFLGGLLSTIFDETSCYSRYQSAFYRKVSTHKPSPYLLQRLRNYEALHAKCGPSTQHYQHAIAQLKANHSYGPMECNYLVWIPADGLGNRLMSLISAFLYALLTNKVLLLYIPREMHNLFCEPFPNSSWVLPSEFPVKDYEYFFKIKDHNDSYGKLLKNKVLDNNMAFTNASLPVFMYLYLRHDYNEFDKSFFCDDSQQLFDRFPWLVMTSNQYFVPAFFLMERYAEELHILFPEKDTVFHHLGRYLLHPSNVVWGYITRYYEAYLANAKERIGIQIRTLKYWPVPFDDVLSQLINCTIQNKILPEINLTEPKPVQPRIMGSRLTSVLVTSLDSGYYEKLKNMYYEHSTISGEVIGFYQPSHEETQKTEHLNHNMKALSEMFLLSFSDKLVITSWSTFGYVAQSLGGLRPWIFYSMKHKSPACSLDISIEPCFHFIQSYDCKARKDIDKGAVVPHVRHCLDVPNGIKLYNM